MNAPMSGRPWTGRDLRKMVERIQGGEEPEVVARSLGRTVCALKRAVDQQTSLSWGEVIRAHRRARRRPVLEAYMAREISLREAAETLGVTRQAVTNYVRRDGLRRPRRRINETSLADERRAFCLRQGGMTLAAIGNELGVCEATVHNLIRRYGARMESWRGTAT